MFDENTPIFLQVAQTISNEILSGIYAEGDQIASTNEFVASMCEMVKDENIKLKDIDENSLDLPDLDDLDLEGLDLEGLEGLD